MHYIPQIYIKNTEWVQRLTANKEFEQELFHARIHDAVTHTSVRRHESILEYVQVIGAGILHGEKSPAVQSVMASPLLSSINITHSAQDGINIISGECGLLRVNVQPEASFDPVMEGDHFLLDEWFDGDVILMSLFQALEGIFDVLLGDLEASREVAHE